MKFAVIGGDARLWFCAGRLAERGYPVSSCCLSAPPPPGVSDEPSPDRAISGAQAIILPIPATTDGEHIRGAEHYTAGEILSLCHGGSLLFGGNFNADLIASARRAGVTAVDYLNLEPFVLRNAYLTAQAALGILLSELPVCLYNAKIALIGFGRISKFLSRMLLMLGTRVTVFARREEDRTMASLLGITPYPTDALCEAGILSPYTAVVNTAPAKLLRPDCICALSPGSLLLELASGSDNLPIPGKNSGVRLLTAHSLPGKCFPRSAGEIVSDTSEEVLRRISLPLRQQNQKEQDGETP